MPTMLGRWQFRLLMLLHLALVNGCTDEPLQEQQRVHEAATLGEQFDKAATGSIMGSVTWQGDLPDVPPFKIFGLPGQYLFDVRKDQPNPNLPRIQPSTLAVQDAIVFLRNVDPKRSRPWDHAPVRIEQRDRHLRIRQGDVESNVGFVRAGDAIAISNCDNHFHMLRGRGEAFFSMPFTDPKLPGRRVLDRPGLVELSSGAFFFWMRGYLLVDHHSYYTRTDERGAFALDKVPVGTHELVCWLPNWKVAKKNRDPETGLIIQVEFERPLELTRAVTVDAGQTHETPFTMSAACGLANPR